LLATASVAPAITISFNGNFNQDDDVVLFQYSVQNTGLVTVATTSFVTGGFSPILTVFDEFGMFLFENVGYSNSPSSDASLQWNSVAGALYTVALTQYDNQANASQTNGNISEGFVRDGQGNFTAQSPFNPDDPFGSFQLPGPEQRTSAWAIEFSSADPTLEASIPEPSTAALGAIGASLLFGLARTRKRKSQVN
jgi:hypothetical protein